MVSTILNNCYSVTVKCCEVLKCHVEHYDHYCKVSHKACTTTSLVADELSIKFYKFGVAMAQQYYHLRVAIMPKIASPKVSVIYISHCKIKSH